MIPLRLALLSNFVPPQRVLQYESLTKVFDKLRVFVSVEVEENRSWEPTRPRVDVVLQRTLTIRRNWRHPRGDCGPLFIHFPYDTVQQLRHFRPDVVLANEFGLRTVLALVYCRLIGRCPCVVWADVSEASEEGRGVLRVMTRKLILRSASAIITNGASGARYLRSLSAKLPPVYSVFIPVPRLDLFDSPCDRTIEGSMRLLILGRLEPLKGVLAFLQELAKYLSTANKVCQVKVVGSGSLSEEVGAFRPPPAMELSLQPEVRYERVGEFLSWANVLVVPSFAETWGLVVAEAMAAGVPVLASSACQAAEEMIASAVNGWLFDWGIRGSLDRALDAVFSVNPERFRMMRAGARAKALEFTPERATARLEASLRDVLDA